MCLTGFRVSGLVLWTGTALAIGESMTNTDTMKNTKKPTIAEFKAWARANRELAMDVCKAKALAQVTREKVDAYINPIFLRYEFKDEDTGEIITDERRSYLAGDDPRFPAYYAECNRAHREHGFDVREGYCPALVAENMLIKAEQLLLNALGEFTGIDGHDYNRTLEMRAKALDLALGACLGDLK